MIVTGNSCLYKTEIGLKNYRLQNYVITRDFYGTPTQIIVKEGLNKDLRASASVPNYIDISSTLSSEELLELNTGFGKNVAEEVFSLDLPDALKKEDIDAWTEVNGIITRIQKLM